MISVIIPVYNCEKYLYVCLNSVLKQTFSDFEVICIDDCSTDSSYEILKYFSKKDSRIRVFKNKVNKGPGYCRNQGIAKSTGKYVFFLDSDDWIHHKTLELLFSKSEKLNLEVLIYKAIVYYDNDTSFGVEPYYNMEKFHIFENNIFDPSKSEHLLLNNLAASPWIKLYNKSFLVRNDIHFTNNNLIQEDEAFNLDVLLNAKRISFLDDYLYNRRRRDNSIMTLRGKKILDNIQIAEIMIQSCLNNREIYEIHKNEILNYIFNILNSKYNLIDDEFKSIFFNSTKEFFKKCFDEYELKEDILNNVNHEILIKFDQLEINCQEGGHVEKTNKYLAIDVGGTAIKYCVLDNTVEIFEHGEVKSDISGRDALYDSLDEIILPHLNQINGIALSFPGVIDVKEGIANTGGSFYWVHNFPLKSILEKRYHKHVWVENDGKCLALGEFWKGNLLNTESGVALGLGTGISGGIILGGKLYRGINGSAGEFSSILDNFENPKKANKLSEIGGYKGLLNRYSELSGITNIDGRSFFEKYHDGDQIAIKVLNDYSKIISTGIITIQSILNVERFCIGGGISSQEDLINKIKSVVHDYFISHASKAINEPKIQKCFFGNNAGCIGALYNFLIMENQI